MSLQKQKIVYIIPTLNEKENISRMLLLVHSILKRLKKYSFKILIVDDLSSDGTVETIKNTQKKYDRIILLKGPRNGLGSAMMKGIIYGSKPLALDFNDKA